MYWELEMEKSDSPEMREIFQSQKQEANTEFFKFVSKNYASWIDPKSFSAPIMSNHLFQFKVLPHVERIPTFLYWLIIFATTSGKPSNPFLPRFSCIGRRNILFYPANCHPILPQCHFADYYRLILKSSFGTMEK